MRRLRSALAGRGQMSAVRVPILCPLGGTPGAAGLAGEIHGDRARHWRGSGHVRERGRGGRVPGVLAAYGRRCRDRDRHVSDCAIRLLELTLDGAACGGRTPGGAGARPAPGSEITRESRARDRLPRIRMVRAAQDVEEAIRCSDPTECRRTIYNRARSTMILPRPRLMPDGTIWAPVVQPVAAFGHGCAFGRLTRSGCRFPRIPTRFHGVCDAPPSFKRISPVSGGSPPVPPWIRHLRQTSQQADCGSEGLLQSC